MTSFLVADDFEGSHDDGGKREAPHMDNNSNDNVEYVQEHVHTKRPIQQDHAIDLMMLIAKDQNSFFKKMKRTARANIS